MVGPTNPGRVGQRGTPSWSASFLHTYPITMMLGIIAALLTIAYFGKRQKYPWEILQILLIIVIPSSILGARGGYLIATAKHVGFLEFFNFQGLAIQGGVMGAVLAGGTFLGFRRHAVDMRTVAGIVMPAVLIGQVIGRGGNFDNHEVYGAIIQGDAHSLDGLTFIKPHMLIRETATSPAFYRQPFFFYESMLNLMGYMAIVGVLLRKNGLKPGATAAIYLIGYGIVRLIMEPLRTPADIMSGGSFQVSTFMSAIGIVVGLGLLLGFQFFTNPNKHAQKIQIEIVKTFGAFINLFLPKNKKKEHPAYISKDKYKRITPIKTRKLGYFGNKSNKRKKHGFGGEEIQHRIIIGLPNYDSDGSKRELNAGEKNKNRKRSK